MVLNANQPFWPDGWPKLALHPASGDSSAHLRRVVDSVQQGDHLTPVTVVGPSVYANLTMRHRLGRSGFANVRFLVFSRLAEFLGAPSLASQGRRPLTPVLENAAVRAVTAKASGVLAEVSSHSSTVLSIKRTFRQIRYASQEALDRLAAQGGLREEVVSLYRSFREQVKDFYDAEDLARAAAGAVRAGRAAGLSDLGFILFFRLSGMSPGEKELVAALAAGGRCAVLLGITGDTDADAPIETLANDLAPFLGQSERHKSGSDESGRSNESAGGDESVPALTASGKGLLIAPDPHEEVRWVMRRVVNRAEQGTPFHRMAVLYGAQTPYDTLVREELRLAGIPVSGPNPFPLVQTAVGRTLTGLMKLSDGRLSRDTVMDWTMGCPVQSPGNDDAAGFSPSHWDAISKKAGVIHGLDQWVERLGRYASDTERWARSGERKGEISEARAGMMAAEAQEARRLLRFVRRLSEDVSPPPDGSAWEVLSDWARRLLTRYLAPDSHIPEHETAAFEKIEGILEGLAAAEEVGPSPSLDVFRVSLEEALQVSAGHSGVTGEGVFVGPVASASAMNFDVVHIAGMIEGSIPAPAGDDPLVPDASRQDAGGPESGLPLRDERLAEERHAFLSALGAAPEATLSFPRSSPAGQRAYYPSRWFLEQASVIEGSPVQTSDLWSMDDRPWLTILRSVDQSLASVSAAAAADLHDYDLERLWSWKRAGLEARAHPLAKSGILAKSFDLGRRRYASPNFTEWDGNLSGALEGSGLAERLENTPLSPTSLEQWAACPFRYFLGHVLRISMLDDPEEIYAITPLEKGSLVHGILEDFIAGARNDGTLPRPGEPWSQRHRAALESIARSHFQAAENRGVTGKLLIWRLEQDDILNDLHSFLEADADLRGRFGVSPVYLEARFGRDGDPWDTAEMPVDGAPLLKFRGVIDRVDADSSGRNVLVMDYKTGGAGPYAGLKDDPIDKGKHLQLGVYSLATRKALGEDANVAAAYWFTSSRGGFVLAPPEPLEIASEDTLARFKEGVSVIVSGIRSGLFPANPGEPDRGDFTNCRFCDFKSLCPSRKDTLWRRKKGYAPLAGYLQLSEGG